MTARLRFGTVPGCLLFCACLSWPAALWAQDDDAFDETQPEPAQQMPLATASLLLDAIRTGDGYLVVGERGHVLRSADGRSWQQAASVPTRSTLTAATTDGDQLWAVGHDSTILQSADGGDNWELVYFEAGGDALLNVMFQEDGTGWVMGSYGLLMNSTDGGETWDPLDLNELVDERLFDEDAALGNSDDYASQFADLGCFEFMECFLNDMLDLGDGRLMIAGERGFGFRSLDNGETWQAWRVPYSGSMFGMVRSQGDCVMAFGLRGNAFETCDVGENWQPVESGSQNSLLGASSVDGIVTLVGASGVILQQVPGSDAFIQHTLADGDDLSAVVGMGPEQLLLVGEGGIHHYPEQQAGGGTGDE